jgi:hypothetical protein
VSTTVSGIATDSVVPFGVICNHHSTRGRITYREFDLINFYHYLGELTIRRPLAEPGAETDPIRRDGRHRSQSLNARREAGYSTLDYSA